MTKAEDDRSLTGIDVDAALRSILEGTAEQTGDKFFPSLVETLARVLGTQGAWITEYLPEQKRLRAEAFLLGGEWVKDFEYDIKNTACEPVIEECRLVHITDNVADVFPMDPDFIKHGVRSYLGVPLLDLNGKVLGHLAVMDKKPMPENPRCLAIFKIFAARAAAERQRMRAEQEVRDREEKLGRLVDGAMDAIIEFDSSMRISLANPAAEKVFCQEGEQLQGQDFQNYLAQDSRSKLTGLTRDLAHQPSGQQCQWIAGGLQAVSASGANFPAEATLSLYSVDGKVFHTLILRNINERLAAEQRIKNLAAETEYLKQEIRELQGYDEIIGNSEALRLTLQDVQQVAITDATVLIYGETGSGKELIARAIHNASKRADQALVKVNCAAIPANLIESEFFGHEKGAFTGATSKREGRFALAHGGTIFLDEVGELPIELQSKLLRILQEGEFEPVGSSKTRKIDVRVLAATNRNLETAIKEGQFREDLFYRLNVFPIQVPPLRERGGDVILLAQAFIKRFSSRMGLASKNLSPAAIENLQSYSWPGNVRELANVIERALITSSGSELNLDRALPSQSRPTQTSTPDGEANATRIHTMDELQEMERSNIIRALNACNWKISGASGAAQSLGMKPSTLTSRIKSLGIERS